MNNYTSSTGSSTGSNSGTQKHLVPSGSFLKSGTKSAAPTSAQTGQSSSQPAQAYTQTTQTYSQTTQTYAQPGQSFSQFAQASPQSSPVSLQKESAYSQSSQTYTQTGSGFTAAPSTSQNQQSYPHSSQAYAQTGRVETSSAQFIDSPNMFLGIIGMLLGLVLSTGLITLLYSLNYFSKAQIIASCFTYVLAIKGYMFFAKGIDFKGTVICSIFVLFMVFFSHEFAIAFHLKMAWEENIDLITSFRSIKLFKALNPEFKKWYYIELVIAYIINISCIVLGPDKVFKKN